MCRWGVPFLVVVAATNKATKFDFDGHLAGSPPRPNNMVMKEWFAAFTFGGLYYIDELILITLHFL